MRFDLMIVQFSNSVTSFSATKKAQSKSSAPVEVFLNLIMPNLIVTLIL
ncbi:hypothetical protein RV11_GL002409 [Enterococcus phoeniculicola]|nr:hypothetical protein RV11_GL002409 [Enterococcus phoeniculicola]